MTFLALCLALYFAPAMIASGRRHPSTGAVFVLNLLVGWTVVGWVLCLVWAMSVPRIVAVWPYAVYAGPAAPGRWAAAAEPMVCCGVCQRPMAVGMRYCGMCGASVVARGGGLMRVS